jgi:hypothetical protein
MNIDFQASIAFFEVFPVPLSLRVTGELVSSEIGVVGREAVVVGKGKVQFFLVLVQALIIDASEWRHHEPAKVIEGYPLFLLEGFLCSTDGVSVLQLLFPQKLNELVDGQ